MARCSSSLRWDSSCCSRWRPSWSTGAMPGSSSEPPRTGRMPLLRRVPSCRSEVRGPQPLVDECAVGRGHCSGGQRHRRQQPEQPHIDQGVLHGRQWRVADERGRNHDRSDTGRCRRRWCGPFWRSGGTSSGNPDIRLAPRRGHRHHRVHHASRRHGGRRSSRRPRTRRPHRAGDLSRDHRHVRRQWHDGSWSEPLAARRSIHWDDSRK